MLAGSGGGELNIVGAFCREECLLYWWWCPFPFNLVWNVQHSLGADDEF